MLGEQLYYFETNVVDQQLILVPHASRTLSIRAIENSSYDNTSSGSWRGRFTMVFFARRILTSSEFIEKDAKRNDDTPTQV